MLIIAKSKIEKEKLLNIKLFRMDATNMKFKDECFDKVLLSLVLHEIDEGLAASIISEAFFPIEVLKPKPYKSFVVKNLYLYFGKFGLTVVEEIHCDYSKVLRLKKRID